MSAAELNVAEYLSEEALRRKEGGLVSLVKQFAGALLDASLDCGRLWSATSSGRLSVDPASQCTLAMLCSCN
jgi:hypothetical protein